jgi:hypothetical protein
VVGETATKAFPRREISRGIGLLISEAQSVSSRDKNGERVQARLLVRSEQSADPVA